MVAEEFNKLIANYALDLLIPLGFKQAGVNFYLHKSPNILVFHKKTFRGSFEGFYLALTHDFLLQTIDKGGKFKVPSDLENYPFSIPVEMVKAQYTKHKHVSKFSYDTNFMTREVLVTRKFTTRSTKERFSYSHLQNYPVQSEDYIKHAMQTTTNEGMKLLSEYSPSVSYRSVTRYRNVNDTILNNFKAALETYCKDNHFPIRPGYRHWFLRWLGH